MSDDHQMCNNVQKLQGIQRLYNKEQCVTLSKNVEGRSKCL